MKTWRHEEVIRIVSGAIDAALPRKRHADRASVRDEVEAALRREEARYDAQMGALARNLAGADALEESPASFALGRASRDDEVKRLTAERDRLLWLACRVLREHDVRVRAYEIAAEHGYDWARIRRTADLPEPAVPR